MRDREMSHRECETPESHKRALERNKIMHNRAKI